MALLHNYKNDNYTHTLSITSEPTFMLAKERMDKDNAVLYSRQGYGYNKSLGVFIMVMNDSNEDEVSNKNEIINPIDTLPRLNKYSADYAIDKKNFISLRDANNNKYLFLYILRKMTGSAPAN